jgi:hypothetical protein
MTEWPIEKSHESLQPNRTIDVAVKSARLEILQGEFVSQLTTIGWIGAVVAVHVTPDDPRLTLEIRQHVKQVTVLSRRE